MNKKINILLIAFLLSANMVPAAYFGMSKPGDYTGDSIIGAPTKFIEDDAGNDIDYDDDQSHNDSATIPPIKKLRLKYRSKYKKIFETPDPNILLDAGIEDENLYDEENSSGKDTVKEKKSWFRKKKGEKVSDTETVLRENRSNDTESSQKIKDRFLMDCEFMDYDNETAVITAHGNVSIKMPEQGAVLYAQDIVFDKVANTIIANNDVHLEKGDLTVTGDYIFIDLNEENALLSRPVSEYNQMEIIARQANMREGVITQEEGSILFKKSSLMRFRSGKKGPQMSRMLTKKDDSLSRDLEDGRYKVKVTKMVIDSEKEHDTFLIQKATIYKDGKKVITLPRTKFYTNKNHDYAEGDFIEIGSKRDAGVFLGPGIVFKLPKGAALKAVPFVSYKDEIGFGGLLRFNSGTNETYLLYGSQREKFIGRGIQELDDNLRLEYATNDYLDEWFLGRARPKYGISLVYDKNYHSKNFLGEGRDLNFRNKVSGGFYQDIGHDKYYKDLHGSEKETYRFKYMAETRQTLWDIINKDELKCLRFDVIGQLSAAVYGTGDTQTIARIGPAIHSQYKRWMQDIGYFQSTFQDDTPMPVYDKYRYGKSNAYVRETIKLHRLFALSWFGSMTFSDDTYNNKTFQECSFYVSLGPDDLRFNVGYDFVRENVYFTVDVALDPKGTEIQYDKLEIKNADKLGRRKDNIPSDEPVYGKPKRVPVLRHAIVEEITT